MSERNINPKLGRDIGSLPGLHLVAVPDGLITRERVINYAKIGILLVPANASQLGAEAPSDLADLLRDAREALSWHWETTTGIEEQNKQSLLSRIDTELKS